MTAKEKETKELKSKLEKTEIAMTELKKQMEDFQTVIIGQAKVIKDIHTENMLIKNHLNLVCVQNNYKPILCKSCNKANTKIENIDIKKIQAEIWMM